MSLRGGYQIINLDNREFSTERMNREKYPEIYYNLLNSHAKFIILSGLNMDGIKWNDREAIFYERELDGVTYFQAEIRRIWDTANKTCTTKFINIMPDDIVYLHAESFIYEPDNDKALDENSTNAVENKVITNEFKEVMYRNGRYAYYGTQFKVLREGFNFLRADTQASQTDGRVLIGGIETPKTNYQISNKIYVDTTVDAKVKEYAPLTYTFSEGFSLTFTSGMFMLIVPNHTVPSFNISPSIELGKNFFTPVIDQLENMGLIGQISVGTTLNIRFKTIPYIVGENNTKDVTLTISLTRNQPGAISRSYNIKCDSAIEGVYYIPPMTIIDMELV